MIYISLILWTFENFYSYPSASVPAPLIKKIFCPRDSGPTKVGHTSFNAKIDLAEFWD